MLFKKLPDPTNAEVLRGYLWDAETLVVHDRALSAAYARHVAPLSLKLVRSGSERYNVHGFHEAVCPGDFLVINEAQPYESLIESVAPVETMCVFFSRRDVLDVARGQLADAALVDDPNAEATPPEFPAVKRRADSGLRLLMDEIPTLRGAPTLARNEFAVRLLSALIANDRPGWRASERVDAMRPSTRGELHRRCLIGRAYIDAAFEADIDLTDIARAAGLSRTHFLRSFKQCFGQTPYQVLRQRRLEQAAVLLEGRSAHVTEVALAVGYNNFSAFARAFRTFHGVAPSRFARKGRNATSRP
ncbi:MAG: AraC family transcriptional regulator [Alphaproteobacteria bacterium]|nr:AraC family transcriptional regulator [Alphaproteobacteria bacterium]MBU2041169.1 AraC family transcriptional regulator [Alphaproteobacteria bacterium]MBU2125526.1 AraC family transcriptional regulator [Alphaproteobacteria bacterium]MBU2208515.1 AraC family transcriptional regulator [Alphaproteobacteria bacterium]MBU2289920.1 AraC family transcriptional regulator [Alphaproteobacteria bacterium]